MAPNKTLVYKKIPSDFPVAGEHLVVEDRPIDLSSAPEGGLLVEVHYASYDPYLRGKMRDPSVKSYTPALHAEDPVSNSVLGKVLKSNSADFKEGTLVKGYLPIAEYVAVSAEDISKLGVNVLQNPLNLDTALFLGPLGMPGLTAWSGLYRIGQPKAGETLFVSSAAGAVGQLVGQIAKHEGLKVVGSVGSDEKLDFILNELGFDAGFNYKKESPKDALPRLAPEGIDIYFENVGGDHLEAALKNMNVEGRIPVCGMIADYNTPPEQQKGVRGLFLLVAKRIKMEGFLVGTPNFGPVYTKEHQEKLGAWIAEGSMKSKLHITEGIDKAAEGLVDIFHGKNFGKALLKIR